MSKTAITRLFLATALTVILTPMLCSASQDQLAADLQFVDASEQGFVVLFSLTNVSDEDLFVLSYQTPLRGIEANLFDIMLDGAQLPYFGIEPYRLGPAAKDWIRIRPGDTLSAKVNLANSYNLASEGSYEIRYSANHQIYTAAEEHLLPIAQPDAKSSLPWDRDAHHIASNSISVNLEYDEVPEPQIPNFEDDPGFLSKHAYYNCQSSSTISSANSDAKSHASTGYYSVANSCNSWYYEYFSYCSNRPTVQGRYNSAYWYMNDFNYYYCGTSAPACQSNWIAYTYHNTPKKTYICPAFWNYGSKGRVILHEALHWTCADDYCYGCKCSTSSKWDNADTLSYAPYDPC